MLLIPSLVVLAVQSNEPIVVESDRLRQKDPATVVCKAQPKTNTRFPTKTCRTRAEWQQISEQAKRDAHEMIDKAAFDSRRSN